MNAKVIEAALSGGHHYGEEIMPAHIAQLGPAVSIQINTF